MPDGATTAAGDADLHGVRVLVLDDEDAVRASIRLVLEAAGAAAVEARNGREGLNVLLRQDVDVLVVDLHMEEMDGLAFMQEARKIWPWMGVVVVTGFPGDLSADQAQAVDVTRVVAKPFRPDVLRRHVAAEAREQQERARRMFGTTAQQVQYQLGMLRRMGETSVRGENLAAALRDFCLSLQELLPCAALGALAVERLQNTLVLLARQPVADGFLDALRREIMARYAALSGRPLREADLRVQVEGVPRDAQAPAVPRSTFVVPIIVAGEMHGILALAAAHDHAFSSTDIAFLYHAANQFSTVLVALGRMRDLAVRDPLTNTFNRRYIEEHLARAWHEADRYDQDLGVAVIDIDRFKSINDEHGHLAGDRILREFAGVIQDVIRTSDLTGRYGGDEFVVVLNKAGDSAGRAFSRRLLAAVRARTFDAEGLALPLTASIGIAVKRSGQPARTPGGLLEQADYALMDAKRGGRDRFRIWSLPDPAAAPDGAPEAAAPAAGPARAATPRVMVVDDEATVRSMLERMLARSGYETAACATVEEGLERLRREPNRWDLVLTDMTFDRGGSGLDLLRGLKEQADPPVGIVMTGYATVDNAVESLRHGAYDFVQKPLMRDQLLAVLGRALEYRRLVRDNRRYQTHLEDMIREQSAALRQSLEQTRLSNEFTLEAFVEMLDAREHGTAEHSLRVRTLAHHLGQAMGLAPDALEDLRRGAQLHDVGKIAIPDAILLKAGPLTGAEWEIMHRHPDIGYRIIAANPALERAAEIVRSHHEHYDGTGYPRRLKGEQICLGARVFAVVDTYDTMRSPRAYKAVASAAAARDEIARHAGTQFDPGVVEVFLRCFERLEALGAWGAAPPAPEGLPDLAALRTHIEAGAGI